MDLRAIILDNGVQPNAVRQGTRRATGRLGGWVMSDETILDEWGSVEVPAAPAAEGVEAAAATTALLVLDIQQGNCNLERRPRCVATLGGIADLLARARQAGAAVVYSLTRSAEPADIRPEVAPKGDEPVVKGSVDKFHGTELERILSERGIATVIVVGTAAHGAVLHTAAGAAMRGLKVIVPVDGMSATEPYAEQYTAWHLANSPGTRKATTLTRTDLVSF